MKCSRVSLLARNLATPCLGREPKAKVARRVFSVLVWFTEAEVFVLLDKMITIYLLLWFPFEIFSRNLEFLFAFNKKFLVFLVSLVPSSTTFENRGLKYMLFQRP